MFKARLISDPAYYIIWKRVHIAGFVIYISLGILFLSGGFLIPDDNEWLSMVLIFILGFLSWLPMIFYNKKIISLSARFWLEIDQNAIKVTDNNGNVDQMIQIDPGDVILANEKYDFEDPPWKFITRKYRKNKITIMNSKVRAAFYFKPDSYYSINQLEIILKLLQEKGCKVERIKL